MRFSEGTPQGRYVKLDNPELFNDHEEVIIFTREEFSRTYMSIMERLDTITKIELHMRSEDWKLIGYWPLVMKNVYRIDRNIDSLLKKEPLQGYLDIYLYETIQKSPDNVSVAEETVIPINKASNPNSLYERF